MKTLIYYAFVIGIIVLSFFFYSSNFYPLLGSDDAVQVLMIHDFKLPHDLYFWGQDRYGSVVPLLGQIFYKGFRLSALTSESVTHYLLLITGYFAFAGLFKSKFSRLVLALVWFFPPIRLIDFLRVNIGLEYSLLAMAIFLIHKVYEDHFIKYRLWHHLALAAITVLFILATWVSDLAAVSVFLILILQVYSGTQEKKLEPARIFHWKPEIYYLFAGTLAGISLILYGKAFADKSPLYNNFNDLSTVIASFRLFWNSISDLLLFKASEPFTGVCLYLVILLTLALFLIRRNIKFNQSQKKWFLFFVLDCVIIFCIIITSKWSYMNGVPRRYFTSNYITFWMAFLLAFECLAETNIKKIMRVVVILAVVTAGAGSLYNLKYIWPKTLRPRADLAREFESLGRIGIIGNYWNSYINSVTKPGQIIATPDDHSSVRNRDLAHEVMQRDTIYVIRDCWFDVYPDSLNQFGTALYKNGEEFRMGDCYVCRYRK
ncbi:MAG: hypothetical protein WCR72_09015 [Bacteroidota bacterium]